MTATTDKGRRLIGAKSILRYLEQRHALAICRQTLHRFRTVADSGTGRLGAEVGLDAFPARPVLEGLTSSLVAYSDDIDAWIDRRRRVPAPDSTSRTP